MITSQKPRIDVAFIELQYSLTQLAWGLKLCTCVAYDINKTTLYV